MNSPKTLTLCRSTINKAGAGTAPGSTAYVNHTTGLMVDLFRAQVYQIGRHFALATVVGNEALGKVRVDHHLLNGSGPAQIGDDLIIGPLEFLSEGPRAQAAWRPPPPRDYPRQQKARPATERCQGIITRVAPTGTFGQVTESPGGRPFFVHRSQLQRGTVLRIGFRVSFLPARTPRGWSALEVRR